MKLHIGNLAKTVNEPELRTLVGEFGELTSLEIARDSDGGSRGFAFAEFVDADRAKAAIAGLDGKEFSGTTLKVSEARPRKGGAPVPTPAAVPQA